MWFLYEQCLMFEKLPLKPAPTTANKGWLPCEEHRGILFSELSSDLYRVTSKARRINYANGHHSNLIWEIWPLTTSVPQTEIDFAVLVSFKLANVILCSEAGREEMLMCKSVNAEARCSNCRNHGSSHLHPSANTRLISQFPYLWARHKLSFFGGC